MKKSLVFILILVIAVVAGYYFISGKKINFSRDLSIYKAIPVSAPLFFEISSAKAFSVNNQVVMKLAEAGIGVAWNEFLMKADSVIAGSDNLPKNLMNSPFIITWGISGRNELVPLLIKKADSDARQKLLLEFIGSMYPPPLFSYNERVYGNYKITEVRKGKDKDPLYYSFSKDLLLVSTKSIIIEQVILQMSTPGILKNPYFVEVSKAAGSDGVQMYINHSRFDGFLGSILTRRAVDKTDEFGAPVRFQPTARAARFNDFAGWSEFDFHFGNEQLLLSGISVADDSVNHFLSVFDDQQPVRYRAGEVLPFNTSFFCSYSFSSKNAFFERLEDFFMHTPDYYHREERMKRFDRGIRGNIRKLFTEIVKDEIIVAAGTIPVNPENKTVYLILHTNGKSAAEDQLTRLLSVFAKNNGKETSDFISEFSVDSEVKFPIYRFPYPSFPGLWLGSPFTMAEARFVSFYGNYMIFSNTETGMHEYLRSMILGTTLMKDVNYEQFRISGLNRANVNVYVDINKVFSYRNELLADAILKSVNDKEESIRKFGRFNWQVQRGKSAYINSIAVALQPNKGEEAKTTWQSVVGNTLTYKPHLMINHTAPSSLDILFQDSRNNLQQVTASGRVRWSVPLPGEILSEIYQIDYYRNGRLQYLFNTADKLYLIDRNGNNVAHFPVKLPSPASNGVNVFDYDNNRNYRYFLAGNDKKIYALDQEGKNIKGWNFDRTEQEVTTPVQHFRIQGKDFIVFKDKSQIYIRDRQGDERISVSTRFLNSRNPLELNLNGKPKLVATDKNGILYIL